MVFTFLFSAVYKDIDSAIKRGDFQKVKLLFSGLNETNPIVYKDSKGNLITALHRAAKYGQINTVKLIASQLENTNPYDSKGLTPMHYAAKYNHSGVIKYYLESINITDKNPGKKSNDLYSGRTPLHYASRFAYLEIVKLILPYLKDNNPPDANMYTPLHLATYNGHIDVVKLLNENISNPNPHASIYWKYYTPFHFAAKHGELDMIKYFVENIPKKINEKTEPGLFGQTAQQIALEYGQIDIVEFLSQFEEDKLSLPNEKACDDNRFECSEGTCVDSKLICDGMPPRCDDKSDLHYCSSITTLPCRGPKFKECPSNSVKECFLPDLLLGMYN